MADEGMTDYLSPNSTPPISCGEIRTVLPVKSLIYSVFYRNFFVRVGIEGGECERVRMRRILVR